MKTVKDIAQEIGVSKQAVFKRMSKEPLRSALYALRDGVITTPSKKIVLSEEAEIKIKEAFLGNTINLPTSLTAVGSFIPASDATAYEPDAIPVSANIPEVSATAFSATIQAVSDKGKQSPPTPKHETYATTEPLSQAEDLKEMIDILKRQLEVKDQQISEKDAQIRAKDAQIQSKDEQIKEFLKVGKELSDILRNSQKLATTKFYKSIRQPKQLLTVPLTNVVVDHIKKQPQTPTANVLHKPEFMTVNKTLDTNAAQSIILDENGVDEIKRTIVKDDLDFDQNRLQKEQIYKELERAYESPINDPLEGAEASKKPIRSFLDLEEKLLKPEKKYLDKVKTYPQEEIKTENVYQYKEVKTSAPIPADEKVKLKPNDLVSKRPEDVTTSFEIPDWIRKSEKAEANINEIEETFEEVTIVETEADEVYYEQNRQESNFAWPTNKNYWPLDDEEEYSDYEDEAYSDSEDQSEEDENIKEKGFRIFRRKSAR